MELAQDRVQWRALVLAVLKRRVMLGEFFGFFKINPEIDCLLVPWNFRV
jgi:hypothetical protein